MNTKTIVITSILVWGLSQTTIAQKQERKSKKDDKSFSIVAFGDMPYKLPEDYTKFENLINTVNEQTQTFNVFVGDIKTSVTPCSEESFQKIYAYFNQFKKPLIYTPGDNEWTDCHKKEAGGYDPIERLAVIRKMFFKDSMSFGMTKVPLQSQAQNKTFAKFVENKSWSSHEVSFATIHIVGSNNFFLPNSKDHNKEFFERDSANIIWLKEVFAEAKVKNRIGVILFVHADMFSGYYNNLGYSNLTEELTNQVLDYGKPVLLVNGDSHAFLVDKPLKNNKTQSSILNFTRLQVFGDTDTHAVKITISPSNPSLFQIEQLIVPGN